MQFTIILGRLRSLTAFVGAWLAMPLENLARLERAVSFGNGGHGKPCPYENAWFERAGRGFERGIGGNFGRTARGALNISFLESATRVADFFAGFLDAHGRG